MQGVRQGRRRVPAVPSVELPPVIIPIAWLLTLVDVVLLYGIYRLARNHLYIITSQTNDEVCMRCITCQRKLKFYLDKEDPPG